MAPSIEIPVFWVFRESCGCVCGSLRADQRHLSGQVFATAEMAWNEQYDGSQSRVARVKKAGITLTGQDDLDLNTIKCDEHRTQNGADSEQS